MTGGRILAAAAGALLMAAAVWLIQAPEPGLDEQGPRHGQSEPALYLFQAYDCRECWNMTTGGGLDDMVAKVEQANASLVWKNVAPDRPYAARGAHCVWQEFPGRWQEWNRAAYERQFEPGAGWASSDAVVYLTESSLLLLQQDTARFEACLHGEDAKEQVDRDTRFWSGHRLPALYDGTSWHPVEEMEAALMAGEKTWSSSQSA